MSSVPYVKMINGRPASIVPEAIARPAEVMPIEDFGGILEGRRPFFGDGGENIVLLNVHINLPRLWITLRY